MPRRTKDFLELIRAKASMSATIIDQRDEEYGYYSGGNFETASRMAMIDTCLKLKMIPKELVPYVKIYRSFLDQQRKAFFASVGSTEITKLGFILGKTGKVQDADLPF